ncbi:MAG: MTH1187 family thiamine-binding protein [Betaproteobacteria bacterium]
MVMLEFSMFPTTQGESKSAYVARIVDIIDKSGLSYQLTPMGTIIEGEWAEAMAVVTACFEALKADCPRIATQIKVDYRAGSESRMQSKIASVEKQLGRKLST